MHWNQRYWVLIALEPALLIAPELLKIVSPNTSPAELPTPCPISLNFFITKYLISYEIRKYYYKNNK